MEFSYLPLIIFGAVMCGTPGPGNLAMMAVGQATGFRSALPFLLGTFVGGVAMNLAIGLGMGKLITACPEIETATRYLGMLYILYLAWKVVSLRPEAKGSKRPFTFLEGLLIHPLSPKSWGMVMAGYAGFMDPAHPLWMKILISLAVFDGGLLLFHSLWGLAGAGLLRMLTNSNRVLATVNVTLAGLMVGATAWGMFAAQG